MSIALHTLKVALIGSALVALTACEEEKPATATKAPAVHSALPTAAPPPTAAPTPPEPKHDCPEGSSGEGSSNKPCQATGPTRTMEVAWNGKMSDDGPSFKVVNTSKLTILYGKIYVYFYDKDGKQIEVKDDSSSSDKPKPYKTCAGRIFGGVMKPGEKAVINFSCVKKSHVPDGAKTIEGELETVGFADASGEKVDFYWRNDDLVPDARPKGGLVADKKGAAKKKN